MKQNCNTIGLYLILLGERFQIRAKHFQGSGVWHSAVPKVYSWLCAQDHSWCSRDHLGYQRLNPSSLHARQVPYLLYCLSDQKIWLVYLGDFGGVHMELLRAIPYCARGSSASQSVVRQSHAVPGIWQSASQLKVLPLVLFYAGWLLWSALWSLAWKKRLNLLDLKFSCTLSF